MRASTPPSLRRFSDPFTWFWRDWSRGGLYALLEIFCVAGSADVAVGLFAGPSARGDWSRRWAGLCGWAASVSMGILRLLSLCLCALWILWSRLLCGRSVYRRRSLVSLGTPGRVLESRLLWPRRLGLWARLRPWL